MRTITPAQVRGARAMLDWSMVDLARAAGVSASTVKRVEDRALSGASSTTVHLIREAFEAAGVEFLDDESRGLGMRFRPQQASLIT